MAEAVGTFGFGALMVVFKLFIVYRCDSYLRLCCLPTDIQIFTKTSAKEVPSGNEEASSVCTINSIVNGDTTSNNALLKELGVRNSTASRPFCLLVRRSTCPGNTSYYGLVAIFFAQLFNIDLSMGAYVAIIVTSTLGAVGQAGVPGPSFLSGCRSSSSWYLSKVYLCCSLWSRIFDEFITALNITGDAACAVIVDSLIKDEEQAGYKSNKRKN